MIACTSTITLAMNVDKVNWQLGEWVWLAGKKETMDFGETDSFIQISGFEVTAMYVWVWVCVFFPLTQLKNIEWTGKTEGKKNASLINIRHSSAPLSFVYILLVFVCSTAMSLILICDTWFYSQTPTLASLLHIHSYEHLLLFGVMAVSTDFETI